MAALSLEGERKHAVATEAGFFLPKMEFCKLHFRHFNKAGPFQRKA
jgi:hypothetical protein